MVDNSQKLVTDFLTGLGLTGQEATIYLTLISQGPLTTLELARETNISRSTVYRLLENLKQNKFVEEIIDQHRTLSTAIPPEKLQPLLQEQKTKIQQLDHLFPQIQTYLNQQIQSRSHSTEVKFYRGITGIQQMAWNILKADQETVGYTQSHFGKAVGDKFAQDLYEEMFFNKITMRDIYSDNYLKSLDNNQKVHEVNQPFSRYFHSRYLPNDKLNITHTMDIYNDTVAIYDWQGNDIFGTEIHNPKVANLQKQIFEILWTLATPETELVKKPHLMINNN